MHVYVYTSHSLRSRDLPFVIGALDKDLRGQDRIGLALCQRLRAICGLSLEAVCLAASQRCSGTRSSRANRNRCQIIIAASDVVLQTGLETGLRTILSKFCSLPGAVVSWNLGSRHIQASSTKCY